MQSSHRMFMRLLLFGIICLSLVSITRNSQAANWEQTITPLGSGFESSYVGGWILIRTQNTVSCSTNATNAIYTRTRLPPNTNIVDWARWRPNLPSTGMYQVLVYVPQYTHNMDVTAQARYTISHADGQNTVVINQNNNLCSWVNLGTYRFNAGTSGNVYMGDYTGDNPVRLIAADGMKFIQVNPNQAPNAPTLVAPTNGSTTTASNVTLQIQDTGDPDNGPRTYRDFYYLIEKSDGSWSQNSGWIVANTWNITLPSDGTYRWRVQSGDGELASAWTSWWSFTLAGSPPPPPPTQTPIPTPPPTNGKSLDVHYVDQVFVQQKTECFTTACMWNYCGPASVSMVLHYMKQELRDVTYERKPTLDIRCELTTIAGCKGGTSPDKMNTALKNRGIPTKVDWNPTFAEIKQSIDKGYPVILSIKERSHVVVISGYREPNIVILKDPYGGFKWWNNGSVKNLPPLSPPAPRFKGDGIEYRYGIDVSGKYAIFITGPVQNRTSANTLIKASVSTLISTGIRIDFAPSSSNQVQANTNEAVSVTYTPQVTPTHPIADFVAAVSPFQLTGLDSNGQSATHVNAPYTLTIDVDPSLANNWYFEDGVTEVSDENGNPITQTPSSSGTLPVTQVVLAAWDNTQQAWIIIPSTFDPATGKLVAQSDRLTEFAVMIKAEYRVNLPVVIR